ncbi:CHAT domain-containing protein [Saccharopolyspora subtropica]|uniref:CHAT domain-containing protein n=1 Tax=Saccharopolyspora thermophila TaxID=89367 RepID=A0A917K6G7_9PSEU|nr:CHAT domain-containing protein [Saccharopolyspora subtropica]GGJ02814.1 CHAT domain-containing protein [Saccharopolyspora subtropica]
MSADPAELDEAVAQRYARLADDLDDETAYHLLVELADLLLHRAQTTGADVGEVIDVAGTLLHALAADSPARAAPLYQLGMAHALLAERGEPEEFRTAVGYLRQLRPLLAEDAAEIVARIGLITAQLVLALDEFEHVDDALAELNTAFEQLPESALRRQIRFVRGMMHLTRFLSRGGGDTDHRAATEDLTAALRDSEDTRTADACHIGLAYLLVTQDIPAELRQGKVTADMADGVSLRISPEQHAEIRRHLDALSPDSATDGAVTTLKVIVDAAANLAEQSDPADWETAIAELDDAARSWDDEVPGRAEITALQAGLAARLAEVTGSSEATDAATERLADAAAALPAGHPMRSLLLSGLRSTSTLPGTPNMHPDEHAAVVRRLEQALTRFSDDDPDRAAVLTPLTAALLVSVASDRTRSTQSLARVRELAGQAVGRGAADPVNAAINHFLLAVAEGFDAMTGGARDLFDSSVRHARCADELLPADHNLRPLLLPWLSNLLIQRFMAFGGQEDLEAARFYAAGNDGDDIITRFTIAMSRISPHHLDSAVLDEVAADLDAMLADLPADHLLHPRLKSAKGTVRLLRGMLTGTEYTPENVDPVEVRSAVDDILGALQRMPGHHLDRPHETISAATALVGPAFATRDLASLNRAIGMLTEVCANPDLFPKERRSALRGLATALRMRFELTGSPRDLNNAIDRFEQVRREFTLEPGDFETANLLTTLADCYAARGDNARRDQQRAISTGLEALRERARNVLLQSTPRRALETAAVASGEAAEVSAWCLVAGQADTAVQALELGRGMVLHAATVESGMPALLRANGHADLAERWEAEVGREQLWDTGTAQAMRVADAALPSDLRYRVLHAFEGTEAEAQLLSPPSVAEIAAGLRAARTQGLVYLLPGVSVLVTADGRVERVPSALLAEDGPVERFDQLQRERARVGAGVDDRWRPALEAVCDWAWTAVLNRVFDRITATSRDRPLRIVLVPVGKLGTVPWHAARRRVPGGRVRYACQDAVICYAASARQFLQAGRRATRDWDSEPVLLRTPELHWSRHELDYLHQQHYGGGTYLGRPSTRRRREPLPTPGDVLARLPGASLLHLACHATPAELPVESALLLGNGEELPVQDILRQARERPRDAPGALVVLAACASDLTDRQHDEVLTLSTAFLAAGAAGVVGTRWEVEDLPTSMFMIVFHHFLNAGYADPAAALRAAQLWMLDPRRRALPGVPEELAAYFAEVDPTEPAHWAAFTYQGR